MGPQISLNAAYYQDGNAISKLIIREILEIPASGYVFYIDWYVLVRFEGIKLIWKELFYRIMTACSQVSLSVLLFLPISIPDGHCKYRYQFDYFPGNALLKGNFDNCGLSVNELAQSLAP